MALECSDPATPCSVWLSGQGGHPPRRTTPLRIYTPPVAALENHRSAFGAAHTLNPPNPATRVGCGDDLRASGGCLGRGSVAALDDLSDLGVKQRLVVLPGIGRRARMCCVCCVCCQPFLCV